MKKSILLSILLVLWLNLLFSQRVSIGTTTPDTSSIFEVKSTTKGLLIPRMTTLERTAIGAPAEGLFVYDLTTHTFWYRNNFFWINIAQPPTQPPSFGDASSSAMSRTLQEQQVMIESQKLMISALSEQNNAIHTDLKNLQMQVAELVRSNEVKQGNR